MELRNLTPHALTIYGQGGTISLGKGEGPFPRLTVSRKDAGSMQIGGVIIPVYIPTLGQVIDLPDPQKGIGYLVSALVADALPEREDLYSPGELVRDEEGVIVGANGLSRKGR